MAYGSWFMTLQRKRRIYLDHASATPLLPEALAAMTEAARLDGNPGAIHSEGVAAAHSLDGSRARLARVLGVTARELIFTSGLTESVNLAVLGHAAALARLRGNLAETHWVTSAIEHSAVLESFAGVEALGGAVTHVAPDARGIISAEAVRAALKKETVFVSVGWANNELGTIQPLSAIAREIRAHEAAHGTHVLLHADAGQAPLYLPTLVHSLGVDLLSLGAAKLHGPHGVGLLYLKSGVSIAPIIVGGKQERGLRAGTENVLLAAGFAAALVTLAPGRTAESKRVRALRDSLSRGLTARIPAAAVNGSPVHALPHMLNVSFPGVKAEYMTLALDARGIAVSTKSACREGEASRSHVIAAVAPEGEEWRAEHTIRFSLGRDTTLHDIAAVLNALDNIYNSGIIVNT